MPFQQRGRRRRRRSFPRRAWKWNTVISGSVSVAASTVDSLLILDNSTDYVIKIRKFMMWMHLDPDMWGGILKLSNLVTTDIDPRLASDDHSWLWWCPGVTSDLESTAAPAYLPIILKTNRTLRPSEKLVFMVRNNRTTAGQYNLTCKFMRIDN